MSVFGIRRTSFLKRFISITLMLLLILEIFVGLAILVMNEYFRNRMARYAGLVEDAGLILGFFSSEAFGVNLIFGYISGFYLANKCTKEAKDRKYFGMLVKIWNLFMFLLSINGLILSLVIWHCSTSVNKAIETSLMDGMALYTNPKWREIWDEMQYREQCCGVQNYKDWEAFAYLEYAKGLKEKEENPTHCAEDGGYLNLQEVPPNSCSNFFQKRGCWIIYKEKFEKLITTQILLAGLSLILQIGILVCMKMIRPVQSQTIENFENQAYNILQADSMCQTDASSPKPVTSSPCITFHVDEPVSYQIRHPKGEKTFRGVSFNDNYVEGSDSDDPTRALLLH